MDRVVMQTAAVPVQRLERIIVGLLTMPGVDEAVILIVV